MTRIFASAAIFIVISTSALALLFPYISEAQGPPSIGGTETGVEGGEGGTAVDSRTGVVITPQAVAGDCSSYINSIINFPQCLGRAVSVWIGTGLIWIAGLFLGIASTIFNWVIDSTVVRFDTVIYATVASGVQTAWAAFRDIANIVIIGIFTFVAIEMILGTQTFGGKRTVAKILVIAILINFSLLFARIIVESSNFVARQFHQAINLQANNPTGAAANDFGSGISGRLSQMMGVAGFKETRAALSKSSEEKKDGWIVLGQGVLTAIIFLAAAAVFFYGAFLMVARAILLIFLIMVSSLAFASWLLPTSYTGGYSFEGWWKALIKAALFGPLLIIMLWATLTVGEGLSRIRGTGQIGGLINNPADPGGVGALFGYLIILGMLFVSIKVANAFSKEIGGFNYAQMATKLAGGVPLAIGARAFGFAGRQYIGRNAAMSAKEAGDEASKAKKTWRENRALAPNDMAKARLDNALQDKLKVIDEKKAKAEKLAGRGFELASTKMGENVFKKLGVPGYIAGGKVESYAKTAEKAAEDAAKRADSITKLKEEEIKAERDRAAEDAGRDHNKKGEDLKKDTERARDAQATQKDTHEKAIEQAANMKKQIEQEIAASAQEHAKKPGGATEADKIHMAEKQSALGEQDDKIRRAREAIGALEKTFKDASDAHQKHNDQLKNVMKTAADEAEKSLKEGMKKVGEGLADKLARSTQNDDYIAGEARSKFNKKQSTSNQREESLKSLFKDLQEKGESSGDEKK